MEHHASTSSNSYQSLAFRQPQIEEEKPSILPMFDSTTHVTSVSYQPHNNPKKKRSRFLKIGNSFPITKPTCSGVVKPKCTKKPPDPSAPKITRPCTECGKKFWSLKALFGHMRCHPERQWRGINPPPNFRRHNADSSTSAPEFSPRQNEVSSQAPKSLPHMIMTDEDHDIASCLLLLANGGPKPDDNDEPENVVKDNLINVDASAEPSASFSGVGIAKCCQFECSSCKKVFGSHQALGGHKASHKNVKGCFASGSGSGLTQAPLILNPNAHDHITTNLDLNFPPPVTLISGEDQYDSLSSYSSTYSGSALDLRLRL
ncbi:zinc finger protein ZAT2-like [Nicotiana tabacum]|uniref:Zinc finger protein ZAT2-like n=1 Tax=Nicotiana tabacum TaxID=4097 RepID=A0AC58TNL7_TOBAC